MDINELRKLSLSELEKELLALCRERFNLRMQKANGQLKKFNLIKQNRRSIARLKTIMAQLS